MLLLYMLLGYLAALLFLYVSDLFKIYPKTKAKRNFLDDLHVRIKPIYLELQDYSFFHSPSGIKKSDKRFIGRKLLLEKLKAILTRSQTKSGAYLITGFRGMGKTSLIRKVLAEISGENEEATKRFLYGIRMIIVISILSVFNWTELFPSWFLVLLTIIVSLFAIFLLKRDKKLPNLVQYYVQSSKGGYEDILIEHIKALFRLFNLDRPVSPRTNVEVIFVFCLHNIMLVALLQFMVMYKLLPAFEASEKITYSFQWFSLFLIWLLGMLFVAIIYLGILWYRWYTNGKDKGAAKPKSLLSPIIETIAFLGEKLNRNQRISVEISLAQDDIKEVDVLRILANRMLSKYRRLISPFSSINRFIWFTLIVLLVYLFTGLFYFNSNTISAFYRLKLDSGFSSYFPSQGIPIDVLQGEIEDLLGDLNEIGTEDEFINSYVELLTNDYAVSDNINQDDFSYPRLRKMCVYFDFFFLQKYLSLFSANPERHSADKIILSSIPTSKGKIVYFFWIPLVPDYLFWFLFLFFLLVLRIFAPFTHHLGIINHYYVLRKLKRLHDNIRAEITLNRNGKVGVDWSFLALGLANGNQKRIPIAGIRQIEEELIDILKVLDRIPKIALRPEFIFIFDEMDKIQGDYSFGIAEKEASELSSFYEKDKIGLEAANESRRRKQAIERILANLKRFFSVAQAKFIFIAGREMYDAALADASDRESFISSIFHEVVYVNSFFKDPDNRNTSYITGLTEQYVCQLLIPPGSPYSHDLKGYYSYLSDILIPDEGTLNSDLQARRIGAPNPVRIASEKRKKILYALQHFIVYLTYRSNGAPKKVTKLLEEQVKLVPQQKLDDSSKTLLAGRNKDNLYLHFNYLDQYRFGFTNYLFKPFLIAKGRQMRDLSDQMLVSTSFLMDHLFKFHNFGFSWRHLEQTPEIISINKAPELRKFIGEILIFLNDSHLEEIVSGLFHFKFSYIVANEISLISKISELEAAAFNFTLDESLHLKKHYKRKIYELRSQYQRTEISSERFAFVNSISLLNVYLGDLYFYDKEYEDAVLHYLEAKQNLRSIYPEKAPDDLQLISTIRLNLRIGLTYEKMKDYESAFLAYGQITKSIRKYIGPQEEKEAKNTAKEGRLLGSWVSEDDKYTRNIIFEYYRLTFQPLLARLYLVEKSSTDRLTNKDISRVIDEANKILKEIHLKEKFIIQAEFYNKIGDLLFCKNGNPIRSEKGEFWEVEIQSIKRAKYQKGRDYKAPTAAYRFYHLALSSFAASISNLGESKRLSKKILPPVKFKQKNEIEILEDFIFFYKKSYHEIAFTSKNKNLLISIATNLSDMGDVLLSSLAHDKEKEKGLLNLDILIKLFSTTFSNLGNINPPNGLGKIIKIKDQPLGNVVIYYFYLSGQFFKRAALYNKYALQLRKILHFIRNLAYCHYERIGKRSRNEDFRKNSIFASKKTDGNEFLQVLRTHIIREALEVNDRSSNFTRRQYLYEYERLMQIDLEHETSQTKLDLFISSRMHVPEIKEMVILLEDIKLFTGNIHFQLFNPVINPYIVTNQKYTRLLELNFKTNLNERIIFGTQILTSLYDSIIVIYMDRIRNSILDLEKKLDQNHRKKIRTSIERNVRFVIDLINLNRWNLYKKAFKPTLSPEIVKLEREYYDNNTENKSEIKELLLSEIRKLMLESWRNIIKPQHANLIPAGLIDLMQKQSQDFINLLLEKTIKQLLSKINGEDESQPSLSRLKDIWGKTYSPIEPEFNKVFNEQKLTYHEALQYLISDSLFSYSELIKTGYLFGVSYMINHTFLGNSHAELADWSKYYHLLLKLEDALYKNSVKSKILIGEKLSNLVDEQDTHYFDIGYHYKKAETNYYLALEMHNEGVSYQNYVLDQMFYLDDDFNDNLYHFSAAMERYYINSGILRGKINRIKNKAKRIELFDYMYHFDFPEEENLSGLIE